MNKSERDSFALLTASPNKGVLTFIFDPFDVTVAALAVSVEAASMYFRLHITKASGENYHTMLGEKMLHGVQTDIEAIQHRLVC